MLHMSQFLYLAGVLLVLLLKLMLKLQDRPIGHDVCVNIKINKTTKITSLTFFFLTIYFTCCLKIIISMMMVCRGKISTLYGAHTEYAKKNIQQIVVTNKSRKHSITCFYSTI